MLDITGKYFNKLKRVKKHVIFHSDSKSKIMLVLKEIKETNLKITVI